MDDLVGEHGLRPQLPETGVTALDQLSRAVVECTRCPRLVAWRHAVAAEKRAAYADEDYWGAPVPGFGDPDARLVIVGLAPGAHGSNRTGRMFTGDRSGDWLFASLHRTGFADRPTSTHRNDGLRLSDAWITAAVRCAPPGNRPTPVERDACAPWLDAELALLGSATAFVCLGQFAYLAVWRHLERTGEDLPRPRPRFGHGLEVGLGSGRTLLASYHPSQQNTFTGKLTERMLDDVFQRVRETLSRPVHE